MAFWLDTYDEALTAHVKAGVLSFARMAAAINAEFKTDFSRNATIGRAGRLGLTAAKLPVVCAERKRRSSANTGQHRVITRVVRANGNSEAMRLMKSIETEEYKLRCVEITPRNLRLIDLESDECRYPYGDGPIVFCGHPKKDGSSYCVPHHFLCLRERHSWGHDRPDRAADLRKKFLPVSAALGGDQTTVLSEWDAV